MAIEKTGVEVDLTSEFENPTSFEENGVVDHVDIDGLNQLTNYYVRGFLVQDGQKTYSDNILDFQTDIDLPSELQRVEYLESDGDSYILLQNVPTQDITTMKVKCQGYRSEESVFGVIESGNALELYGNIDGHYCLRWFNQNSLVSNQNCTDPLDLTFENDIADFNGEQVSNTDPIISIGTHILLFGVNNEGSYVLHDHAKINEFITSVCHLVPCYVRPGETVEDVKGQTCFPGDCGFYDCLNSCFYSNDGSSPFIPGPDL